MVSHIVSISLLTFVPAAPQVSRVLPMAEHVTIEAARGKVGNMSELLAVVAMPEQPIPTRASRLPVAGAGTIGVAARLFRCLNPKWA